MFKTFFISEIKYVLRQPATYIYIFIFFIIEFLTIVMNGDAGGSVLRNAPYVINYQLSQLNFFALLVTFALINHSALKDYKNKFDEILFTTPLQKSGYFFGRFFALIFLATFPGIGGYIGIVSGSWLAPVFDIVGPERFGYFYLETFLSNYIIFILPNAFITGSIMYAISMKWKHVASAFIGVLLIIIITIVASTLVSDIRTQIYAAYLDLFGSRAFNILSQYYTVNEKNTITTAFSRTILWNRLLWIGLGTLILFFSYRSFSLTRKRKKLKK